MKLSDAALKRRDELLWEFCGDRAFQDTGDHEDFYNEGFDAGYIFAKEESKAEVVNSGLDIAIQVLVKTNDELRNENAELSRKLDKAKSALNRIAMLGSSGVAYTSDFTEKVNTISRGVLKELGE